MQTPHLIALVSLVVCVGAKDNGVPTIERKKENVRLPARVLTN